MLSGKRDKKRTASTESDSLDSVRALAELIGLASRLGSASSVDDLLLVFARGLADIWPGTGVRLCEVRKEAGCLLPLEPSPAQPIPIEGSLLGTVATGGSARAVADLAREPAYLRGKEAPPGLTWSSAILCPIPSGDEPTHVVGVFLPDGIAPGPDDRTLLERAVTLVEPLLGRWTSQDVKLKAFRDIAVAIAGAVDSRDPHLVGHGSRVSEFAQAVAKVHGLERGFIERLGLAGLLHDIGRLGVPETILAKPGPLSPAEFRIIRAHPDLSVRFLKGVDYLSDVFPTIRHHHERYEGGGYPSGLEAEDNPLGARLLAVADAFDAMTSPRPYRSPLADSEALAELKREQGKQFDPILVEAFVRAYDEKLILSQNVLRADDPLAELRLYRRA